MHSSHLMSVFSNLIGMIVIGIVVPLFLVLYSGIEFSGSITKIFSAMLLLVIPTKMNFENDILFNKAI